MTEQLDISPEKIDKPAGTLEEAIPLLRRPFTVEAVHWKVQASFRQCESALIVPYIDARLAGDRLDLVCPGDWQEGFPDQPELPAFLPVEGGLLCRLTVFDRTRGDVGQGKGKALYSDAFKRAAVKFGIGRSLYAFPKTVLDVGELLAKRTIQSRKGPKDINVLLPAGYEHMQQVYRKWLEEVGVQVFERPLDHGDRGESVGDAEAELVPGADELADEEESPETRAGKDELQGTLQQRAEAEGKKS